jgi:mRNA interferase MazF
MHPIWLARLDKTRPVVVLTRDEVRAVRQLVTIAPITSTARGRRSEVVVGQRNGLDHDSVINLDSIATVRAIFWCGRSGRLSVQSAADAGVSRV